MIKAVIMDVGKTVVTNRIIDFKKALLAVYELDKKEEKIDFTRYYDLFSSLKKISFYPAREIMSEVRIGDFLEVLNEIAGINAGMDKDELEWFFQCNLIEEELIPGVYDFLKFLKEEKLPLIALSNSCMTSKAIKREFKEFGVDSFFLDVISSADILVRKPRKEIFDYAYGKLLKVNPEVKKEEILFIGDNYECDIIGSANAGMVPVWLNWKHEKIENNSFTFFSVDSYQEIEKIIKQVK